MIFGKKEITITQKDCTTTKCYGFQSKGNYIISPHYQPKKFSGDSILWILPDSNSSEKALMIKCGKYSFKKSLFGEVLIIFDNEYKISKFPARPACDFFGKKISLDFPNGKEFEAAYARFYWDNLLPQVAERTFMRNKEDVRDGYVMSTLNKKAYAGTYPAVDHEFHMKGRFAVGGEAEKSLIKRMLQLQLKIMKEDKTGLSKNVCAIQPNRKREYDVWRDSRDHKCKAQMFRITANIEFIEGVYEYYSMSKDIDFIQSNIDAIEKNCDYIEMFIDSEGLLDTHVYYEDQVMKDGKVEQAQCFAHNSLKLMAEIERLIGRSEKALHYEKVSKSLGETIVKDFPNGFWDKNSKRFIDWIDKNGTPHDHIHLLANELPILFGLASQQQAENCEKLIEENEEVFSKFPSYVSAKIEDYTETEIGTGGPYDLCAAGRYWCWDASYKAFCKNSVALHKQLLQVSNQAMIDNYLMGERYDMNYIYYNTGKDGLRNWHGASLYYEYPNVFIYVLICKYIGVSFGFDCDLVINPLVKGKVILENYGIEFDNKDVFHIKNIGSSMLEIDLPFLDKRISLGVHESFRSK